MTSQEYARIVSVREHRRELLDGLDAAKLAILNAQGTGENYAYWQSAQGFQRSLKRALKALDDALVAS